MDETDLGNRGLYHATDRFTSIDRFCEKYPWQSPYVFAANNPILNVDIRGDSAWSVKRDWNESDVKNFATYSEQKLKEYEGQDIDCADLSLSVLIDYASENGLALQISNANGDTFDSNSDNYNSVSEYKNGYKNDDGNRVDGVLPNVQARDISTNTFTINKTDVQPGDMIILTAPANHIVNYSQVAPKKKITYGNLSNGKPSAVETHNDWTHITQDSRGVIYKYLPNAKTAHRWKILDF
ncbi:hypothetical protein TRIP_D250064 [uncultured Paludibacter sp.]|uniref:Uncharacterized protein n=1 Tax=uncultured Paludibacter sp. TaxID=497635 RepID=A0A653A8P6_9BACT|nr:hypothetical protein TRIP_D250064 [uncultured Paludibacter sp.]